jgi:hypothetical protein
MMSLETVIGNLRSFQEAENARLPKPGAADLSHSLGEIERYLHFLCIIHDRFVATDRAFRDLMARFRATPSTPSSPDLSAFNTLPNLSMMLQLDIESMYLFTKTLLDKVASAVGVYFGPARGCSFVSHDDLRKSLNKCAAAKGLVLPNGLEATMQTLQDVVVDFRDKLITHKRGTRHTRGIAIDTDDKTLMVLSGDLPSKGLGTHSSEAVDDLLASAVSYLDLALTLITSNSQRSHLLRVV